MPGLLTQLYYIYVEVDIVGLNETLYRLHKVLSLQVPQSKLRPHFARVDFLCEVLGSVFVLHFLNKDSDSFDIFLVFLINLKSLFVHLILWSQKSICNIIYVVVVQLVNVLNDFSSLCSHGCENEKILEFFEWLEFLWVQKDFLEQNQQLVSQVVVQEGLHCHWDLFRVFRLWQNYMDDLLDQLVSELVGILKSHVPQLFILSLDQVLGLESEHLVLVCQLENFHVAGAGISYIGQIGKMRVPGLRIQTNYLRIVVEIVP